MPQVTIDGRAQAFEPGDKLLQFLMDQGTEIPHFCYHPALSVPANCRQCLVKVGNPVINRDTKQLELDEAGQPKIQYFPKLMPGCALDLADGMVVHTQLSSEEVVAAQAENLEFLLINHPLDCPICDQAGHCPLQIQAYKYGPEGSRFEFDKVHKPKRVQLGPHVILDAERCINCTRCTRFTEEVSKSHQLTIVNRGDHNYPMTAPGVAFDDPYSMCVADICPVGALTEDYFRFKARVWEMSDTPTVSDLGAKGSNVTVWVRNNLVLRITARENLAVNDYWLPDVARLVYNRYNEDRPEGPTLTSGDGAHGPADWRQAYDAAALLLKRAGGRVLFLGSPFATVEDNYLLGRLAEAVGAEAPGYLPHVLPGAGDGWLLTDDQAPNTQGCERLGFARLDGPALRLRLAEADVLYVLEDDPVGLGLLTAEDLAGKHVVLHHYHTTNGTLPLADVALPAAMSVETVGTYVNEDGHAQRLRPAKVVRQMNRALMMATGTGVSRLDRQATPFDRWSNEGNQIDCLPGWASLPEIAERLGHPLRYKGPEQVMAELAAANPAFAGATYKAMDLQGVALQDVGEPA